MNVLSYILSFCKCEKEIEFDAETIDVLRAIYKETDPDTESEEEEFEEIDSEDSDYEPSKNMSSDTESERESDEDEEIIVKRRSDGHYYLY
jgi:predicted aspartyl protease